MNMKSIAFTALSLLSNFLIAQLPAYVPVSNLEGFWTFSGNANDAGPNGYNGTVTGAQLSADRFGNPSSAYSFNGSGDFIGTNYFGVLGTNQRAVSFWAKTQIANLNMAGVSWGNNQQATRFTCMFNYAGTGPTMDGAYGAVTYNSPSPIQDNQWHHYIFQMASPTLSLVQVYQDGVLLTNTVSLYNPANTLNTLQNFAVTFGKISLSGNPAYFNGQLDDIGIWSRTLTPCEITQLYTASLQTGNMNISATKTLICAGQQATLTASGSTAYNWNTGSNSQTIVVSPASNTVYSVTGSAGNCGSASASITINVQPLPSVSISPSPATVCVGGQITLLASGAVSYQWSTSSTSNSLNVSPGSSTSFTVTGFNNVGCSKAASIMVEVIKCTGISESFARSQVQVFPNPAASRVQVLGAKTIIKAEIYDCSGRLVKKAESDNLSEIDLSELSEGLYQILLLDEDQALYSCKVVRGL